MFVATLSRHAQLQILKKIQARNFGYFSIDMSINQYRRGLETFPQAKTSKSGREYFSSFFRHVRATSRYQRQVENTRVHFWTFLPVSVNAQNRRAKNYF